MELLVLLHGKHYVQLAAPPSDETLGMTANMTGGNITGDNTTGSISAAT